MKRTTTLLALLLTTGLATASAFAGPNGSKNSNTSNKTGPHKQKILQKYDTNNDGVLDANEKAAFKADRAKHKQARQAHRAARIARFDTNGNGTIDPAEKRAAIIQRSNTRFDHMLVKLDTNGDKMLSAVEFAAKAKAVKAVKAVKAGKAGKAGKARKPGKAKARFARMDADDNGLITRAEFRTAALARGTVNHGKKRGHGKHQGRGQGKAKGAPTR